MEFRLLGALEAGSGGTVIDLGPPKQRALLAILLLHVGEIVPVERLIDLLWGDAPPRTADHSVQIYVSELRKALEPLAGRRLIHRRPPGYQLDTQAESVDANRFEALVRQGSEQLASGDRERAISLLRSALELWRGPALSDFAYEEFAQPYVRRLGDLHLDAIETLAAAELEAGHAAGVVALLESAIREDPLRERSRELLMVALYRSGRHAEALRTYEHLRELLVEELGLEPSPPLQQLRDRVLLHDASLLKVAGAPAPAHATARNPYKGLQPFAEEDADDYFGREALVEHLVSALAEGQRLIGLVGPSGSGKSSVVAAGLVPELRRGAIPGSDRWVILPMTVGADPLGDLQALLRRIGPSGATSDAGSDLDLALPSLGESERIVLVLDQFEQLFTATEESRRNQFLGALARAVADENGRLVVVLSLRADYYDRPLQHPEFSAIFIPGVVHVLPMTARELEAAVVEPAERVGVTVDGKLLAELVADSVARPGSLPLLQYALTELFEQRTEPTLTLAGYTSLGGLRGVLTRRAEGTFLGLGPEEQRVATQVFLRLVRLGRGTADSRRRLAVAELTELGIDPVALSEVLTSFGRHRLLTFDRDELTGNATVELAHEALLTEWERLAGWIDRHRAALRRRDALLAAVDEWELAGRNPEYLLTGSRLAEFEAWRDEGSLRLTTVEREYLEAGLERRRTEAATEEARQAEHRRLARSARTRLVGLATAAVAAVCLGGAIVYGLVTAPPPAPAPVAYLFTDPGIVNVQSIAGFDQAVSEFGLVGIKYSWKDFWASMDEELGVGWADGLSDDEWVAVVDGELRTWIRRLATDGVGMIMFFGVLGFTIDSAAQEYPQVNFVTDQRVDLPNVAVVTVADQEPSYLAGAAAAMTTDTGTIGYLAGIDWEGLWPFQAGFEAGARSVDPDIEILVDYVARDDGTAGFIDTQAARERALAMYRDGADVIFHAAGQAGLGLFQAADEFSDAEGRDVWAIGVDSDQYETVTTLAGATDADEWREHILTSVLKGIDTTSYVVVAEHAAGTFTPGPWNLGLAAGMGGISYSGGFIDHLRPTLEDLEARIISGEIVVPCVPAGEESRAAELNLPLDHCHDRRPPIDVPMDE